MRAGDGVRGADSPVPNPFPAGYIMNRRGSQPAAPAPPLHEDLYIVGAANLPSGFGRMNGSIPFGLLELTGDHLRISFRPRWLGAAMLTRPLDARPADVREIYGLQRRLPGRGLGVELLDGSNTLVWWYPRPELPVLLSRLERSGFRVSATARRVGAWTVS